MTEVLDRGIGKYAQCGVAWRFICALYFSFLRFHVLERLPVADSPILWS